MSAISTFPLPLGFSYEKYLKLFMFHFQSEELSSMKSLQKDLEDALRRARGDADHFKKQLTEAHRVAMSQASVAASVHAATSQVRISSKLSI